MTSVHAFPFGAWTYNYSSSGPTVEERLDYASYYSRHTTVESPEVDDDKVEQVSSLLKGLSAPQLEAAETHGMAGLSFADAGRVLGKSHHSVAQAWYRVVEKATGETPPPLERRRETERRKTGVKNPRGPWLGVRQPTGTHGLSMYKNHGCRCPVCSAANSKDTGERRRKLKAGKIAKAIELRNQGLTKAEAARIIGTKPSWLYKNVPGPWKPT